MSTLRTALRLVAMVAAVALAVAACKASTDDPVAEPTTSETTGAALTTSSSTAPPTIAASTSTTAPATTTSSTTAATTTTTPPVVPLATETPRLQVFGDSTAFVVAGGLEDWAARSGRAEIVQGYTPSGCSFGRGGTRSLEDGAGFLPFSEGCVWTEPWRKLLVRYEPDVAVLMGGTWDVIPRTLPGDDVVRLLGDPVYDEWLAGELRQATELLLAHTDHVVWISQPPPAPPEPGVDNPVIERIERFNALVSASTEGLPGVAHVDLATWVEQWPGGIGDGWLRPDGIHFSEESVDTVADWLGPAIVLAANSPSGTVIGP